VDCFRDDGAFRGVGGIASENKRAELFKAIHLNNPDAVKYPVRKTGFYCVSTYAYSGQDYKVLTGVCIRAHAVESSLSDGVFHGVGIV
jgi:hypothetical protein